MRGCDRRPVPSFRARSGRRFIAFLRRCGSPPEAGAEAAVRESAMGVLSPLLMATAASLASAAKTNPNLKYFKFASQPLRRRLHRALRFRWTGSRKWPAGWRNGGYSASATSAMIGTLTVPVCERFETAAAGSTPRFRTRFRWKNQAEPAKFLDMGGKMECDALIHSISASVCPFPHGAFWCRGRHGPPAEAPAHRIVR